MSELNFSVSIDTTSLSNLEKDILKEIYREIDKNLTTMILPVRTQAQKIVKDLLIASDTFQALKPNAELYTLLCLEDSSVINSIVDLMVNKIKVEKGAISISLNKISTKFQVSISTNSFQEVVSLPNSSYVTRNGITINWLDWLLSYGDSPILNKTKLIRTNKGVIAVSDQNNFSIPNSYAGYEGDNFITKALSSAENEIGKVIQTEISRRF